MTMTMKTFEKRTKLPELDVLLASICYLMTRHARAADPRLATAIYEHLQLLTEHPDCSSEVLKNAGLRLSRQWQCYLVDSEPKAGGGLNPSCLVTSALTH